ncbi:MAG: DUF151 domain-containing protein [Candidatus Aenigmarchaeota archaeon]|nr:bifunctional nuclease family protein [Candidatus Aenigmarchaeota archaeon]MCX8190959.1 bifunctional nuclease family protein [Candidatus Aenigmarchaeota archaeon]MDW8160246.1 DUF151 domain-containing protein [Candidatus Aenigmarchaeota archaeon]
MKAEKILFFIVLILGVGVFVYMNLSGSLNVFRKSCGIGDLSGFTLNESEEVKIDVEGFIETKVSVDWIYMDKAQIVLKAGCYAIKATTDACIGEAILKGLEKRIDFRPSIYDVISDSFKSLGIKVLGLKIVEIRNNTFIGQLIVQQRDKVLTLDIRPSDGTAIALRMDAPIYINESLAKELGEKIC